jgi:hypothetical protein
MKLVKQSRTGFQYQLSPEEAQVLRTTIRQFPLAAFTPVTISKTDPEAIERQKLINESLAAHRSDLKNQAAGLVHESKFKASDAHKLFSLNFEERETMLQILNDIRVESWRKLEEPEDLELEVLKLPQEKIRFYQLMHIAGYFEHHFLNLDEPEK